MSYHVVEGKNKKHKVHIFTLSTCGWCKKTKALLKELDCEYSYVDMDLLEDGESDKVKKEMQKWNPAKTFPTIVVNDKHCIVGYDPDKIKGLLG